MDMVIAEKDIAAVAKIINDKKNENESSLSEELKVFFQKDDQLFDEVFLVTRISCLLDLFNHQAEILKKISASTIDYFFKKKGEIIAKALSFEHSKKVFPFFLINNDNMLPEETPTKGSYVLYNVSFMSGQPAKHETISSLTEAVKMFVECSPFFDAMSLARQSQMIFDDDRLNGVNVSKKSSYISVTRVYL